MVLMGQGGGGERGLSDGKPALWKYDLGAERERARYIHNLEVRDCVMMAVSVLVQRLFSTQIRLKNEK